MLLVLMATASGQDLPIPDPVVPARQAPATPSSPTLPGGDYGRYNAPYQSPTYTPPAPAPSLPTYNRQPAPSAQQPYAPAPARPSTPPGSTGFNPAPPLRSPNMHTGDPGTERYPAGDRSSGYGAGSGAHAPPKSTRLAPVAPAPDGDATASAAGGALGAVGPGDTLAINIMGTGGTQARATVDADGQVVVPLLGNVQVAGLTPSAIGKRIEQGLRSGGFMTSPQVAVEVLTLRSRIVSVLGKVERPGRYPIEGHLSVLELLAMAGGTAKDAADMVTLVRRADGNQRINLYVSNRQSPSQTVQDTELQPGDVVFVPDAPRFYVYGEVGRPGGYPIEQGLNVMRALSLAGGLTPRASDSRIDINHTDVLSGKVTEKRARMTDAVQPGDVIHVNERIF